MAIYIGDKEVTGTIPEGNYEINKESYCTIGSSTEQHHDVPMEYKEGKIYIGINQKNTKCYVYLEKENLAKKVLDQLGLESNGTVSDFSKTACDANTNSSGHTSGTCTSTDSGLYSAQDDYGTSYYYRGTVNNNWVKFAGYWWRIIRINGNGSIRMIYSGNVGTKPADGRWSDKENSQTTTSAYNSTYGDNTYVGYYIGSTGASTESAAHSNATPSTIAGVINGWYTSSGLNGYASKLDGTTGWCNDRGVDSTYGTGKAYGTNQAGYQPRYRLVTNKSPILTCENKSRDLFTTSDTTSTTNNGNKKLTVPVGLITADEVAMAGAVYNTSNYGYYLYTGNYYWTMSPFFAYSDGWARVFYVDSDGWLDYYSVNGTFGVRPVINLKAGTTLTNKGSGEKGTIDNPYEVS